MTLQEAYNTAKKHLLTQMKKAEDQEGWGCRYRTDSGLKCAIGALIPDDEYKEDFEKMGASSVSGFVPALSGLPEGFLDDLQGVHDRADPGEWAVGLAVVAGRWGLTP